MNANIVIEAPVFVGAGGGTLDDFAIGGAWNSLSNANALLAVRISTAGATDQYEYSSDGGMTWSAPVDIGSQPTSPPPPAGITFTFGAATGHFAGDYWTVLVTANSGLSGKFRARGPGGRSRALQDKLRDTISVKDFGAKGDGITDDTAAIGQANLYASLFSVTQTPSLVGAVGGRIHFPRGKYMVSLTPSIPYNVVWEGESPQSTCIAPLPGFSSTWTGNFPVLGVEAPLASSAFVVSLGELNPPSLVSSTATTFGSGIVNMTIDCGTELAHISALLIAGAEENTLVHNLVITNYTDYGVFVTPFDTTQNVSGLKGFWMFPRDGSQHHRSMFFLATGSRMRLQDVTIAGTSADSLKSVYPSIETPFCQSLCFNDLHFESTRVAIRLQQCFGIAIDNLNGLASVGSCLDIDSPVQTPVWLPTVTYAADDRISWNGIDYYSLQASNINNAPDTSPDWWIAAGPTPFAAWSSAQAYIACDTCTYSGAKYIALKASTNKEPDTNTDLWTASGEVGVVQASTFIGSGAAYCLRDFRQSSFNGSVFAEPWDPSLLFLRTQTTSYNSVAYTCVAGAAQSNNQPDLSFSPLVWIPAVPVFSAIDHYADIQSHSRVFCFLNRTAFGFDGNNTFPLIPVQTIDVMAGTPDLTDGPDTGIRFRRRPGPATGGDPAFNPGAPDFIGLQFSTNQGSQTDMFFGMDPNGDLAIWRTNIPTPVMLMRFPWAGGIDIPGSTLGSPIPQHQNDYTSSRALDAVYQNMLTTPIFITVTVASAAFTSHVLSLYTGPANPPALQVGAMSFSAALNDTNFGNMSAWVLPGYFYQVSQNTGAANLILWIEWS